MSKYYGYRPETIDEENLYEKSKKYGFFMRKKRE